MELCYIILLYTCEEANSRFLQFYQHASQPFPYNK
jgi:hypothetical protein